MFVKLEVTVPHKAFDDIPALLAEIITLLPSPLPTDLTLHIRKPDNPFLTWTEEMDPTVVNLAALTTRMRQDMNRWQNLW